jgi:hypothetical protein
VPLLGDAFFRARDCVGSPDVAAHDLYRDLVSGHLPSAIREFDGNDIEVNARILERDYWRHFVLKPALPVSGKPVSGMQLGLRDPHRFPFWRAMFYVQRAKLNQLYPAPAAESEQTPAATGIPRKDTRGAKSNIDWESVLVVAAELMVRHKYRRLVDLKAAIYDHFKEEWPRDGVDDSTLTRHLSALHSALKGLSASEFRVFAESSGRS